MNIPWFIVFWRAEICSLHNPLVHKCSIMPSNPSLQLRRYRFSFPIISSWLDLNRTDDDSMVTFKLYLVLMLCILYGRLCRTRDSPGPLELTNRWHSQGPLLYPPTPPPPHPHRDAGKEPGRIPMIRHAMILFGLSYKIAKLCPKTDGERSIEFGWQMAS